MKKYGCLAAESEENNRMFRSDEKTIIFLKTILPLKMKGDIMTSTLRDRSIFLVKKSYL